MLRWARGLVCMPCDARAPRRARHLADGARRTGPAATPRSPCRSTTSTAGSGIGAADRAHHDPPGPRPRRAPDRLLAARPRVPAARPPGRRARAARPHRGRGRPRPPRRPPAGRGDLRGAPRRRLARAPPVPRAVRRGAPHRDDLGRPDRRAPPDASTTPSSTACARRSCCSSRAARFRAPRRRASVTAWSISSRAPVRSPVLTSPNALSTHRATDHAASRSDGSPVSSAKNA